MTAVWSMAIKDLRLLLRDRAGLFWVIGFPLIMAVFFGSIFGGGGGGGPRAIPVALVDEDGTASSQSFVERLEKLDALQAQRMERAVAEDEVRRGKRVAYIALKPGFGGADGLFGGQPPPIEVGIDPSRRMESEYLRGLLIRESFQLMQERFSDPVRAREQVRRSREELEGNSNLPGEQREVLGRFLGDLERFYETVDPAVYRQGTQFEGASIESVAVTVQREGPQSPYEISFPQAILWGLIGCISTFAISIVNERVWGTFLRLRIAPVSRGQILAGKGLACFVACTFEISLLLAVGRAFFGVRLENIATLVLAVAVVALGFVGIMMMMSVLGRTEQAVAGAGWGILIVMMMFGGGMVPLMAMPDWMQTVSHWSPVKWAILALEGAVWRGFGFQEMALPCAVLLAVGTVCFTAGVSILRRAD